ncbi:ATP-grasp domain-containing protein [Glycomyces buryatensis]|uniref:ATP-grasp domain-containing protein n=1 Tax=Glycomyces buryatensis TaxID=2570927 RepID=A0A4S8QMF7_9ACTN|nr:ATP-grasp domain-containing protein [Glycomyces buryatensis]THV42609.1 ATP-grasp domain-containing protein [Glycomyces buryatensis]
MSRPTIVLVYQRLSLPWVFEGARRAGIDIVLIPRRDEEIDPARLPEAVVEVLRLDLSDRTAALAELRRRHREAPFDGITTLCDPEVPFVAEVAEALGLPGIGSGTAQAAQDKRVMRERLAAAGLNVPGFVRLDGPDSETDASALTFPVVVKPARGFSSLGVVRVDRPGDLSDALAEVRRICRTNLGRAEDLIVEEYLDGPEYAVESLAYRGEVRVLSIGYKGEPTGPYFEETVYRAPAALPEATVDAIEREVVAAHAAIGLTDGPAHTELRLREGKRPFLLEMGARVGGSGVSHHIVAGAVGADLAADALRIAVGREPERTTTVAAGAAANYIVPCGGSGRITAIHGLDELRDHPSVDHLVQILHPGDVVRPYPDFTGYPAFVLSTHRSTAEAEQFHRHLDESIRIDYAPEGAES